MAKKTQETLLQQVVQLLRKQNQLSTRDRLRESEEAKRQEMIQSSQKVNEENQSLIIDDATDFKRRYLAGQAKTFTDALHKDTTKGKVQKMMLSAETATMNLTNKQANRDRIWRLQDRRDQRERDLETGKRKFSFMGWAEGLKLRAEKKIEGLDILRDAWKKFKIPILIATVLLIGGAYLAIRKWHEEVVQVLAGIKVWSKGVIPAVVAGWNKFVGSVMKWAGYDKNGKPIYRKVDGQWKAFGWAGLVEGIKTRMSNIRLKAFNSIGLGVDGKPLGNRPGPRGSLPVRAAWMSAGYAGLLTRRIGKIFKPITNFSAGISKWMGKATWRGMKSTFDVFKNLGIVKFLGRILWPVTLLFGLFEGFKSGKKESEKEGSTLMTIIGEATGGLLGYIVGGLADVVKNVAVWLLKKAFGLKSNKDGTIIKGQSATGDVLRAIQEFSFMDLIRKLVAAPFHLISGAIEFIRGLFTSADYRTGVWEWITAIPGRIANWVKGMIPDWARKIFGIEIGETGAVGGLSESALTHHYAAGLREITKLSNNLINPDTGVRWGLDPSKPGSTTHYAQFGKNAWVGSQVKKFRESEEMQAAYIRTQDQKALNRAIQAESGQTHINTTVVNYEAGGYGDTYMHIRE
jgi:hypothetical protein